MANGNGPGWSYPSWWPTVVSAIGCGLAVYIVVDRVQLSAFYPVVVVMIGAMPLQILYTSITKGGNGNGNGGEK